MLKSKARRRIATRAAVAGVIGTGVALVGIPAIGAFATPVTVTYNCKPSTGSGEGTSYAFSVDLTASNVTPTPSQTVTATLKVAQPLTGSSLPAPSTVPSTDYVWVEGEVIVTPGPGSSALLSSTPTATSSVLAGATASANSPLPLPLQGGIVTIVPTATGVVGLQAGSFIIKVGPTGTAGTLPTAIYTCALPTTGAPVPAKLTITVKTAAPNSSPTDTDSGSPSPTPTSPTPTPTRSSPKPTHTVYETVTNKPSQQVTKKPGGGASTGGGGDAGPDGRAFVLVGTVLVAGAGVGGLMMRRRRPQRG